VALSVSYFPYIPQVHAIPLNLGAQLDTIGKSYHDGQPCVRFRKHTVQLDSYINQQTN
jgi:hypothetical protein